MGKGRLEAFSDGVIAILITIMVLEIKVPEGHELADLGAVSPYLAAYLMSFIYLGIYWNNHHHLIQAVKQVNGRILWANLHLLFWLSLVPLGTLWMGESHFARTPVAIYGALLLGAAIAYYILARSLIKHHGENSTIAAALGADFKGKISIVLYVIAMGLALWVHPLAATAIHAAVGIMWLVPDTRIERILVGAE
ncbi:MAG TPA: TMEM175 family protein [Gemmatimonadaceae bacterium]|nr:TMEM175 family protein [Gemmatimonadaceae bacterium]